jgi:diguanylate cyclase (GGDEF)-like protein
MEVKEHYRTATVVPLAKEGHLLGALALYSVELATYEPDHLRLVEAVAKLASDAIANAVHHQKAEANALTDSLTGLANARALRYRFEEEADRARRHRDIFSIVMMDLDGFKVVNDRLGHQAGDHLLREVGQLLLRMLRSADFVCRYAGDEFVILLQVGSEEVQELVHRIQKAVDKQDFAYGSSRLFVGISVGWACFGADGESLDQLLIVADRSMYADKSRRKSIAADSGRPGTSDVGQYRLM